MRERLSIVIISCCCADWWRWDDDDSWQRCRCHVAVAISKSGCCDGRTCELGYLASWQRRRQREMMSFQYFSSCRLAGFLIRPWVRDDRGRLRVRRASTVAKQTHRGPTDTGAAADRRSETRDGATRHSQAHYCVVTALQATYIHAPPYKWQSIIRAAQRDNLSVYTLLNVSSYIFQELMKIKMNYNCYSARSQASAEYWIYFAARFGGVHAFGYDSAESEPIWIKFWSNLSTLSGAVHCRFWRDFVFCQVSNGRFHRFPVCQISRNWTQHVDRCRDENFRNRILKILP